ncbi:GTP-binding protein [Flavobacterium sp. LC2016-12]|uniref:leucine-rich repeat domain-containing protein n=1 Tax=Flavobacterium sp. LC2016-12 TaxID=2783794 RepID=UPI00188B1690|nr:GTP-binding protein [Flavobacterium sp. LC2016-12]MBF4465807.1 GTP-binding protein [Flavobacterium sp. LC2016-12]
MKDLRSTINMSKIYQLALIFLLCFASCQKDDDIQDIKYVTDAGTDALNIEEFKVQLNASELKSDEKGIWIIESGLIDEQVFIENKDNPKAVFHGLPGEKYKLIWKVTNSKSTALDTIAVSFNTLKIEIENLSPSFYKTRLHLQVKNQIKGKWTVEGKYVNIWNQNFGGTSIPDEESPNIKFFGLENTPYKLTWTTKYGSKSFSKTFEFNSGVFQQEEALEDLALLGDWSRVKKDNENNVISIHLGGDGYAWRFGAMDKYPALQSLTHLKKLTLYGDGFYTFPEVIANKYLDLEVLDFSGNAISKLPENIGNLKKLDSLTIYNNQDNKLLPELPASFGNLTNLSYLKLSGMGLTTLPESFSNLRKLQFLDLEGNFLDKLPTNFGNLVMLNTFRGPNIVQNVPASFSKLISLKFCFFFSSNANPSLPGDFGKLVNLETLTLYGKYKTLPKSFTSLKNLKQFQISGGSLLTSLPDDFGALTSLETLIINGVPSNLPASFSNLKNLKNLQLTGSLQNLPVKIGDLKKLEYLAVDGMQIKEIPESFGGLTSLKFFNAASNQITVIPASFGNLTSILTIDLSYNKIAEFPNSLSNLSNTLYDFTIRGNNFREDELKKLQKLLPKTRITPY